MIEQERTDGTLDRRSFMKVAGAGLTAATAMTTAREQVNAQALSEKNKLDRIASCSWPILFLFKTRPRGGGGRGGQQSGAGNGGLTTAQMKQKYGEITMLDFPQFTKDTFPGVTHMDIRS